MATKEEKLKQLEQIRAEIASLKGADQPAAPKAGMGQAVAEASQPVEMLKQMAPSNVLPAAAVATKGINDATGLSITTPRNPIADPQKALEAVKAPIETAKQVGKSLVRGAQVFAGGQPTAEEKPAYNVGKWGGIALELVSMPSSKVSKGGAVERAAESLDTLAGVPRGSSFALLQNPSKWTKIFQSRAGVKAAYQKAVEAGESVAENVGERSFSELAQRSQMGAGKTVKDLAKEVGPLIEGAEKGTTPLKTAAPMLVRFRKTVNDEIGRLKNVVERGLENEKAHNVAVERLVNYQEMARRVNKVLDVVAPKFREADKLMESQKQMAPFRQGLKAFAFGTAEALAAGTGQQSVRVVRAADMLADALKRRRENKKK